MAEDYRYDDSFSGNLAVLCSDERFAGPTLRFMEDSLDIAACDLVILPGGPEFIAAGQGDAVERLGLLVKAHNVRKIILFSHEDCGYYKEAYQGHSKKQLQETQIKDLKSSARDLEVLFPQAGIVSYYCRRSGPGTLKYSQIK